MRTLSGLRERLRAFLFRASEERELDEELRFHLEKAVEANLRKGMSGEEALRQARFALGSVELYKEEARDAWSLGFIEHLGRDMRHAVRGVLKHRSFTAACLTMFAVGIGPTAAIFSAVNGLVFRPLPFVAPDRLVQMYGSSGLTRERDAVMRLDDMRRQSASFDGLAGYEVGARYLSVAGGFERVMVVRAERDFFPLLGVPPISGRTFGPDDAPDVVVVGEAFWRQRLDADPSVIGTSIHLDDRSLTVIGIMPSSFQFPYHAASLLQGVATETRTDVWLPLEPPLRPSGRIANVVGRLKPAVSLERAEAELARITGHLAAEYPDDYGDRGVHLAQLSEAVVSPGVRRPLFLLFGAVGLVLVLTCANVANLALVRATLRDREVAVRLAIGASRLRLAQQSLAESLVLSLVGGLIGLAVAWQGSRWLMRLASARIPRAHEVSLDWRVFLFLLVICLLTAALVSLAPILVAVRKDVRSVLGQAGERGTMSTGQRRMRDGLVIAEVALACVLAVAAAVLIRETVRLRNVDTGMVIRNVVTLHVGQSAAHGGDGGKYYEIANRVTRLPGVLAAGFTQLLPLQSWGWTSSSSDFILRDGPPAEHPEFSIELRYVTPGYFEALGIPVRGRVFGERDDAEAPPVILINESLARRYFGDTDPVGTEMNRGTIIGVVTDVRQVSLDAPASPEIYFPIAQNWSQVSELGMSLVVRTDGPPERWIAAIRSAVRDVDAGQAIFRVRTMDQLVEESMSGLTLYLLVLGSFAGLALILAIGGTYAVISYITSSRSREFAIRSALGADAGHVMRHVLGRASVLVVTGLGLGAFGAIAATPLLRDMTVNVHPPGAALFYVVIVIGLVAIAACIVPARRAGGVESMSVLRRE